MVLAVALCADFAFGCTGEVTELIIVVDTDLPVGAPAEDPDAIDVIEVAVVGAETQVARLVGEARVSLPVYLGVVPGAAVLPPITVTASATRGGVPTVSRTVMTGFVRGEIRMLSIYLSRTKPLVACALLPNQCIESACESIAIDPAALPRWRGRPPRIRTRTSRAIAITGAWK